MNGPVHPMKDPSLKAPGAPRERLAPWRESDVTTLVVGSRQPEALRTLADAL